MGSTLSTPVESKGVEQVQGKDYSIAAVSMQGYRPTMEDAHFMFPRTHVHEELSNHPNTVAFGVFDGHGGFHASEFLAEHAVPALNALPYLSDENLSNMMEGLDARFLETEGKNDGSTSCITLITTTPAHGKSPKPAQRELINVNVGDSRCLVISKQGKIRFATVDHEPDNEEEEARITKAGHFVSGGRIDGDQLNLSRAIGDASFKQEEDMSAREQPVIALPTIHRMYLNPDDIVLVMCDGLTERMSNEEITEFVHEALTHNYNVTPDVVAEVLIRLIDTSLAKSSKDNMSAILWVPSPHTHKEGFSKTSYLVKKPRNTSDSKFMESFYHNAQMNGFPKQQVENALKDHAELDTIELVKHVEHFSFLHGGSYVKKQIPDALIPSEHVSQYHMHGHINDKRTGYGLFLWELRAEQRLSGMALRWGKLSHKKRLDYIMRAKAL